MPLLSHFSIFPILSLPPIPPPLGGCRLLHPHRRGSKTHPGLLARHTLPRLPVLSDLPILPGATSPQKLPIYPKPPSEPNRPILCIVPAFSHIGGVSPTPPSIGVFVLPLASVPHSGAPSLGCGGFRFPRCGGASCGPLTLTRAYVRARMPPVGGIHLAQIAHCDGISCLFCLF